MTDVFHEWKNQRFIIAAPELLTYRDEKLVILTDYKFWAEHIDELSEWCSERNAFNQGMTVLFSDEITLMEFVLRWA